MIPKSGNVCVASDPRLCDTELVAAVKEKLNDPMLIEVGHCTGNDSHLDMLKYHKTLELDLIVIDLVLLLTDARDICDNTLDISPARGHCVPAGIACEFYGTTFHFASCKVSDGGLKCVAVLLRGINLPLERLPENARGGERLL